MRERTKDVHEARTSIFLSVHLRERDGVVNALLPGFALEREEGLFSRFCYGWQLEEVSGDDKLFMTLSCDDLLHVCTTLHTWIPPNGRLVRLLRSWSASFASVSNRYPSTMETVHELRTSDIGGK